MGKSKTTTEAKPWQPAETYALDNMAQQKRVFDTTQPQLEQFAGMQRDTYGRVAPGAEAGIISAQGLVNRNLSGANLTGNPFSDAILGITRQNVTNQVNDQFGTSGRFGGGMHQAILERELADAENQARFQNYNVERAYQQDAIGQAQSLMGGSQSLIENAASLPWLGVNASTGAVRQASNGYGTQTQTQSGGLGQILAGVAGTGLGGWAGGGFKRL